MPLEQLALIAPAALEAAPEGRFVALRPVTLAQTLRVLFVTAPAPVRVERGFEAAAVNRLVNIEVAAVNRVLGLLGVAQAHPPALTRRVDALGPGAHERLTRAVGLLLVVRHGQHDRAPAAERVLVDEQLV